MAPKAEVLQKPGFEPEFVTGLKKIFEELIVFNRVLGLKVKSVKPDSARARIAMRPAPRRITWS